MPLAALFVVQVIIPNPLEVNRDVSMPLAALFVVQEDFNTMYDKAKAVSMPLAALFVVQARSENCKLLVILFQCSSRLCLWCKMIRLTAQKAVAY